MVTGSVSLISMENSHANAGSAYHKDHPDRQMTDDDDDHSSPGLVGAASIAIRSRRMIARTGLTTMEVKSSSSSTLSPPSLSSAVENMFGEVKFVK